MKPKIAVYAIAKNEEKYVLSFYESSKEADLILIADTGSDDNTVEIASKIGIKVYSICIAPWRFDHARIAALSLVPNDIDICVSLDLDEELQPGWRDEIERVWALGSTTRLRYQYDWGSGIQFGCEKIHARHGYSWHNMCHEYPKPDERIKEVWAETSKLLVRHNPDMNKSRGQYLDLLALSLKEDPNCAQNALYYARELVFNSKWYEAIAMLKNYLGMAQSVLSNERSYAMRLLSLSHRELEDWDQSLKWGRLAAAEAPNSREPWCDLAMTCYLKGMWTECYTASTNALLIKEKELVYTADPKAWSELPHDLASVAAWNLGLKNNAKLHCEQALKLSPNNERLKNNLNTMKN